MSGGASAAVGTATAAGPGAVTLSAALGPLRAQIRVGVQRAVVGQVDVRRANGDWWINEDSVPVRTARQYRAVAFARATGAATQAPLAGRAERWSSSDTTVARVSDGGVLAALREGLVRVGVEVEGVRGEALVRVRAPLAARLEILRAPDSVRVRRTDTVRVALFDSAGNRTSLAPRVSIEGGDLAFVTAGPDPATPLVRGLREGVAVLVASGDGLTVRRPLTVVPLPLAPPPAFPREVVASPDDAVLLATRLVDEDGFPADGRTTPAFESADPAVAATGTGTGTGVNGVRVTARALGTTRVRVRAGEAVTEVPVTVVPRGAFTVDVLPAGPELPAAVGAALRDAAARWQQVVVGDLPDVRFTITPEVARACGLPATAAGEVAVDDLRVYASVDSLDGPGGVLAQAGPCVIRGASGGGSALVGRVQVDAADVAAATAGGLITSLLEHELGHVLGIGTLWTRPALGLVAHGATGWTYGGARGRAVGAWWLRLPPAASGGSGVPLGDVGPDAGGAGHWAEATFANELMTPLITPGANPLSLLTIEALADLGYLTSAAGADAFGLYPGAGRPALAARAASAAPAAGATRGASADRVRRPQWQVDAGGRLTRVGP